MYQELTSFSLFVCVCVYVVMCACKTSSKRLQSKSLWELVYFSWERKVENASAECPRKRRSWPKGPRTLGRLEPHGRADTVVQVLNWHSLNDLGTGGVNVFSLCQRIITMRVKSNKRIGWDFLTLFPSLLR